MRASFAYAGAEGAAFEVPDRHEPRILEERLVEPSDEGRTIEHALAQPYGARLDEALRDKRRVLLLVDDHTRSTRLDLLLPHVERALRDAGVVDESVTVLTAQGTHRRMTQAELDAKLGPFSRRWRIAQHDWKDASSLAPLGTTRGGMPIEVSRRLLEADLVVGIGRVAPHAIMGFSGGAKIVHPGVSGPATESWTHWEANWYATEALLGNAEGPIRREIEEGARIAGLDAVLNVVQDPRGKVHHAAFGDPVDAHRACARAAASLHAVDAGQPADVVILDSSPADLDYWQSAKGLYAASILVREGGSVVLVSPNPEGVAANHPTLLDLCELPLEEIRRRVAAGLVPSVIAASIAAYTARIRERARIHLFSTGIGPRDARRLGFVPHASVQEAVDAARAEQTPDASVIVVRGGGSILPIVRGRNDPLRPAQPRRKEA